RRGDAVRSRFPWSAPPGVVKTRARSFSLSCQRTQAYGRQAEAIGKSRRPTPDAAQRLDDRLAWHAGVGRLGRVPRRVEDKEVGVDGSCLGADGEEPALPLADDVEEGDRADRAGLTFGGQAAVEKCAECSANSCDAGCLHRLRMERSYGW